MTTCFTLIFINRHAISSFYLLGTSRNYHFDFCHSEQSEESDYLSSKNQILHFVQDDKFSFRMTNYREALLWILIRFICAFQLFRLSHHHWQGYTVISITLRRSRPSPPNLIRNIPYCTAGSIP